MVLQRYEMAVANVILKHMFGYKRMPTIDIISDVYIWQNTECFCALII